MPKVVEWNRAALTCNIPLVLAGNRVNSKPIFQLAAHIDVGEDRLIRLLRTYAELNRNLERDPSAMSRLTCNLHIASVKQRNALDDRQA
jgi:hypothetical protein